MLVVKCPDCEEIDISEGCIKDCTCKSCGNDFNMQDALLEKISPAAKAG